ncbi:MAG: PhzF family phenazine biosynthesis protein [Yoonia sp.]|uniref:PhzF family phenazine biosynthesis protein n=1 Tax=Yoonia sp. TaxID=2212373 RepID=UPI00273F83D8|nr:PhzF family phenazine biosynthesis protein [Yoonia sp.]MDP5084829.1 PhzF family phenazine biosynthesis protein [Yoonia sp.]
MTPYFVYDVFSAVPFGGNPLAVIPDATGIAEDRLQKIAREFNFSETTFVYPPDDPNHTARVRIFTPTMEIPFAGHPTIGTAIALRDEGRPGPMVLELGVGPIPCAFDGDLASFTTSAPLSRRAALEPALLAACLGLDPSAVKTDTHGPVYAGVGLEFAIVELADQDQLAACAPVTDQFKRAAALYPASIDFPLFAYVRDGMEIKARMFAPLDNIPEDPATGSACAALAALLTEELQMDLTLDILQGETMGRPSYITASTQLAHPVPVTVSGQAVRTMQGLLVI